jgi:hypothetical protein
MNRSTGLLVATALVAAQALACQKERTATLKAGGGRFNEVRYQIGDQDISLGRTALPWSKTLRVERGVSSVRLDVWSTQQQSWCEIWLDGQLCDREDGGRWCACYRDRKSDSWSGSPNDDERRKTRIR